MKDFFNILICSKISSKKLCHATSRYTRGILYKKHWKGFSLTGVFLQRASVLETFSNPEKWSQKQILKILWRSNDQKRRYEGLKMCEDAFFILWMWIIHLVKGQRTIRTKSMFTLCPWFWWPFWGQRSIQMVSNQFSGIFAWFSFYTKTHGTMISLWKFREKKNVAQMPFVKNTPAQVT